MKRLLCKLLGHKPIERSASSASVVHRWTACGRCWKILTPPQRTAIANRRFRRRVDRDLARLIGARARRR